MRKVLLRFVFDNLWNWQSVGNELHVGAGWLILFWILLAAVAAVVSLRLTKDLQLLKSSIVFWLMVPTAFLAIYLLKLPPAVSGIPVFGYGFMLFVGFSTATLLATRHARQVGLEPDVIWDLMMWLLIPGLIGARINFLMAEGSGMLAGKQGLQKLIAVFALWDGGIVFYGSVIGGLVGLLLFCRRRQINPIVLCDVVAPSLFVGEGFGRIGCFLYGCCFGRACTLPWSVSFPPDSMTYEALLRRGTIDATATHTIALHPTQIYSSIAAFLLAGLLTWYFRRRPFDGAVLGLAWILYPINRFVLEHFRDDTRPIDLLGMNLALGQWVSLALLCAGIPAMWLLAKRNRLTKTGLAGRNAADRGGKG